MISQGMPLACHRGDGSGDYFCVRGVAKKTVTVTGACALLPATSLQMWSINRTLFSSWQTAMQELGDFTRYASCLSHAAEKWWTEYLWTGL